MSEAAHTGGTAQSRMLSSVNALRPMLHRYCARLMGSVIEGEDVVQDVLARTIAELVPEDDALLRAKLFRIAHNRALDLLRSRAVRALASEELHEAAVAGDPEDSLIKNEAVRTAISRFAGLPPTQRSVVILKDVLDHSLKEIAGLLELSVDAVKAHLSRGRAGLKSINARELTQPVLRPNSPDTHRYVDLFNRRDWEGLRALLAEDVRLVQSTHPPHVGKVDVGTFFGIYSRSPPVRLVPAWLEDREVIAVFEDPLATKPDYFMWLDWQDGWLSFIRDHRYARYVMEGAELTLSSGG